MRARQESIISAQTKKSANPESHKADTSIVSKPTSETMASPQEYLNWLQSQLTEAHRVIKLYRRWEHAEASDDGGDDGGHAEMLTDASFAAEDFMQSMRQPNVDKTVQDRRSGDQQSC